MRRPVPPMLRRLHRHRGYIASATTTLAVAVGVNLVVFTVVNALWLRPLPFPEADRLVTITNPPFLSLDAPALRTFEAVAGQVITSDRESGLQPRIVFDRVKRNVETVAVTPGYFQLFRLAIRGRDFTLSDDRLGAEPVAIISDRLWSRDFARRPDVIGAVAAADPFPIKVIGVAPPDFQGARRGEKVDVWIPATLLRRVAGLDASPPGPLTFMAFARLHRGQTPADVARRLVETADERQRRFMEGYAIVPLRDVFGTPESRTIVIREGGALRVVGGLAMLVLFGGCATLMALVLVHYERRRSELAVRLALGASRARLAGELSREVGILAIAGTVGAVLIALWALRSIPSLSLPGGVDLGRLDLSMDWRVLGVAAAATVLTLVTAAWLPIARFTRASLAGELAAGPAMTTSASSQRVRQALLALHACVTIVVLVAAGLFIRAVIRGFGDAPGFDAGRTAFVTMQLKAALPRGGDSRSMDTWMKAVAERTNRLTEAFRSVPGVDDVATGLPPVGPEAANALLVPGGVETRGERRELLLGRMSVSPALLRTLGIPILAGRGLTASDATANPSPAVVTASLADRLWPGANPLGQVLSLPGRGGCRCQVVGIARDFTFGSFSRPATGVVMTAGSGRFGIEPHFVIRAADPGMVADGIRKAAHVTEPEAEWLKIETGQEIVTRDLGRQRLGAWFFSGFGVAALVLGVGGVFGLVAYLAESRQREFGVRLALGATPRSLVWRGMVAGLGPVAFGVAAGLFLAAWLSRLVASLLAGVSALDPLTYATVGLTMVGCATVSGLCAALRVRSLTATEALRTN